MQGKIIRRINTSITSIMPLRLEHFPWTILTTGWANSNKSTICHHVKITVDMIRRKRPNTSRNDHIWRCVQPTDAFLFSYFPTKLPTGRNPFVIAFQKLSVTSEYNSDNNTDIKVVLYKAVIAVNYDGRSVCISFAFVWRLWRHYKFGCSSDEIIHSPWHSVQTNSPMNTFLNQRLLYRNIRSSCQRIERWSRQTILNPWQKL